MAPDIHVKTLFHLVPLNELTEEALLHPDNKLFVSPSAHRRPGLEIGFYIPRITGDYVLVRVVFRLIFGNVEADL